MTSEYYYPAMNFGLSKIAEALSCDVRIAAHPRSDYKSKPFKYSLPILKDQTFELIKQASVVVSHGSTALQWAVIMRKPIIMVTTDEMNEIEWAGLRVIISRKLVEQPINLLIPKDILRSISGKMNWELSH